MDTKSSNSLEEDDGMDYEDLLEPPILSLEPSLTYLGEERLQNTGHINDDIASKTWSEIPELTDFVTVGNDVSDEEMAAVKDGAARTESANLKNEATTAESENLEDEATRTDLDDERTQTESADIEDGATGTESSANLEDEATSTESAELDDVATRTESANLEDEATRIESVNLEDETIKTESANLGGEATRTDSANLDDEATRNNSANLEDDATRTDSAELEDESTRTDSANLDCEATRNNSANLEDDATRTASSDLDNVDRHKLGNADMQERTDIDNKPLFNNSLCVNVKTEPINVEEYTGWPVMREKNTPIYIESDTDSSVELREKNRSRNCFVSLSNFKVKATKDGRLRCLKCNSTFKKASTIEKHIDCRKRYPFSRSKADNVPSYVKVGEEVEEPDKINTTLHDDRGQVCEPGHLAPVLSAPCHDKVQIKPEPNDKVQVKPEPYWNDRCEPTAEPYEEPSVIAGPFQNAQLTHPASFQITWRKKKKRIDPGPNKCSLCQRKFGSRQQLRDHVAELHVEMDFLFDSEPADIIELTEEEPHRGQCTKKDAVTGQPIAETIKLRLNKKLMMSKSSDQTSGGHRSDQTFGGHRSDQTSGGHGLTSAIASTSYGLSKEVKPEHELIVNESENRKVKPAVVLKKCGVVKCFINKCKESHYSKKSFRCHIVSQHAEMNEKTFSALLDAIPASFWRSAQDGWNQDIIEIDDEEIHDAEETTTARVGDTPSEPISSNKKRKRTEEGDQLSCLFKNCSKTFTLEQDLVTHLKEEIEAQNRKIEAAEELDDIIRPEDLLTHLSDCNIKDPIVIYVCTTCGQIFFDCKRVKIHQQITHGCTCNSKMEIWRREACENIQHLVNHVNKKNKAIRTYGKTSTNYIDETDNPDGSGMSGNLGSNKILKYIWAQEQSCECEPVTSLKCEPVTSLKCEPVTSLKCEPATSLKIRMISSDPDYPGAEETAKPAEMAQTKTYPAREIPESTAVGSGNCGAGFAPSWSDKPGVYAVKGETKQPSSVTKCDMIAKTLTHWTSYKWQKWVKNSEKEETDKGLVQQDIKSDKSLGSNKKSAQAGSRDSGSVSKAGNRDSGTFKCCFATCREVFCCEKSLQQHIQKKHLHVEFKRQLKKRHLP